LEAEVVIAGDGPERAALESLADELGARNIQFIGFQPPEVIGDLYNRALLTVVPSRWYENGPLVILESYDKATPVIGADIGAIPDFVQEGQTGFLFRANDADDLHAVLQSCLADREKLLQMGQRAKRHVAEDYSPKRYVKRLETILESVLP
jgi:glycosyltransferase involved in cell wall biosynthesis